MHDDSRSAATETDAAGDGVARELADEAARQAAELERNAVDSLPEGALAQKLALARREGRQMRVKLGIDPTAPDIHLGHAVVLGKLREFQDRGHRVVLIVGDWTARVGDPSGRSELRPMLSREEIERNAETFQEQATRILDEDPEKLEVRRNSEWLDMGMAQLLKLVRTTTVAQMLERDDFAKRYEANEPVSILELLYPLLQGYDSVAVRADVEVGGTDQKFNLLLGRDIQRHYGQSEQAVLTMPILVGIEGHRKMSKSLGNQIGVTDEPGEMYGKTMSIPDEAMAEYYELLLGREPPAELGPRDAKRRLARELVAWLHGPEQAEQAEAEFDRMFVEHKTPTDIANARARAYARVNAQNEKVHTNEAHTNEARGGEAREDGARDKEAREDEAREGEARDKEARDNEAREDEARDKEVREDEAREVVHVPEVMAEAFGMSRSEARRMIDQGGVALDDETLKPGEYDVAAGRADGAVLRAGKRKFARVRVEQRPGRE